MSPLSLAAEPYTPQLAPVGGSLAVSALIALIPLLTVFMTLGRLRWKAHWAGLTAVAVAILVAVFAYKMPVGLALLSATEGGVFGLFPIMGVSIPFCFLAALVFKAPQPLTHGVNYAMYPLQIPLIFAFVRLGEWIMGAPNVSLAPSEILELARTDMVRFVEEFGLTCLHAVLAWSISAPLIFVGTFSAVRPVIARLRDKHLVKPLIPERPSQ